MENITFNLSNLHVHGTAFMTFCTCGICFCRYARLAHPHDEEVEMDQNGNPKAWY